MPFFVGDLGVGGVVLVIGLKAIRASVYVIGYFELFFDMVFKFLYVAGLFVLFGEVVDVPLTEGGDKATYHGVEHIHCEPCKAVSCNLGGSWGEGSRRCLSHNG